MQRAILIWVILFLSLLGAKSKPMWRRPSREGSSSGRQPDSEGTSSAVRPSAWVFEPQEQHQPWSPFSPGPTQRRPLWPARQASHDRSVLVTGSGSDAGDAFRPESTPPSSAEATRFSDPNWEATMRRATGRPSLVITPIDKLYPSDPRIFVAYDNARPDRRLSVFDPQQPAPESHLPATEHFTKKLDKSFRINVRNLPNAGKKRLVYFNSQSNLDYLNREYFGGRMRFLPINAKNLNYDLAHTLLMDRKTGLVLPPREKHGLALLVAGHVEQNSQHMKDIQALTGKLQDTSQVVSLWSPGLMDGTQITSFLYGIGQLDMRSHEETVNHLNSLAKKWGDTKPFWDAVYYVDTLPKEFAFQYYPAKEEKPELREQAERSLEEAHHFLRSK